MVRGPRLRYNPASSSKWQPRRTKEWTSLLSKLLFPGLLPTWALFTEMALSALVVILAGSRLTRMADTMATRLNLASGWIGLLLLATVTSLPELVTGGTATAMGNVDLALGAIFGSCCFNITIIVLLNALWGGESVLGSVSPSHSLTSSFGILLIGEALLGMVLMENSPPAPQYAPLFEVGWALLIAVTYLVSMRLVYNFEKRLLQRATPETVRMRVGRKFYARLFITTLILIVASWWLTQLGDTLSTHEIEMIGRPLGATFVGACFLALATSLPEIATSVAAVRIGNLDLALGNIFGSNMFNIFVIPILKAVSLCTGQDRLLAGDAYRGSGNLIAGLLAVLLTAIALGALTYKSKRRMLRRFGLDSILIAIIYAGGMILLVGHGGN